MSKTYDMIAGSLQELIDEYETMGGKNSRMTRSASNSNRRKSSLREQENRRGMGIWQKQAERAVAPPIGVIGQS